MSDSTQWSAENSAIYRQLAQVAVPRREEQIAALLMLIPFGTNEAFRVVELASGEGRLAQAILQAFPKATLLALDGEESMRAATAERLAVFGERAQVGAFDMRESAWYPQVDHADVVLSSLCVHHLTGEEKRQLSAEISKRLSSRGAFLLADLIFPQRDEGRRFFAATWDRAAEQQSLEQTGSLELYEMLVGEQWNYYDYPDSFDKPSPLFDQLVWLKNAGFEVADCFWMHAGHAIYGGYKRRENPVASKPLEYEEAVAVTKTSLL